MRSKCSRAQHLAPARDGHEHVAALGGRPSARHHLIALHARLERAQRIDLADDHRGPGAARAQGHPASGPAVAEHHHRAAREQQVGRAQDPVDGRLAGAEAVVEGTLGARLVDRQHRAGQHACFGEGAQPQQTGRRLLGAPQPSRAAWSGWDSWTAAIRSAPSSIVTCGLPPDQLRHVLDIALGALAAGREHASAVALGQRQPRRRPGSRAGWRAHSPTSAPPASSARTRLAVSAVTCRQAATSTPASGRSRREALAHLREHRHLRVGPLDPRLAAQAAAPSADSRDPQ